MSIRLSTATTGLAVGVLSHEHTHTTSWAFTSGTDNGTIIFDFIKIESGEFGGFMTMFFLFLGCIRFLLFLLAAAKQTQQEMDCRIGRNVAF